MLDRRGLITTALASVLTSAGPVHARACAQAPSLGAAAERIGVTFGCSVGVDVLADDAYVRLILREARILTTDLAFKLPFINPQRGRFDFAQADRLVAFARQHKLPLRAHTLFWDLANPEWLGKLSVVERRSEFDRILDTIMGRYVGQIHSWDLVNEPFWPGFGEPGGFRRGAWYDALGRDYVARAFQRAARIDPATKLVLNCDMTEQENDLGRAVRRSVLELIDDLLQKGCKLDAIGLQGHLDPALPFDPGAYEAFLSQIAERRIPVYITELDVLDTSLRPSIALRDMQIAEHLGRYLAAVLKVPNVEMVMTWQLADSKSWYRSDWYRSVTPTLPSDWRARPLPFDDALERKQAWYTMERAFCEESAPNRGKARTPPRR